MSDFRPDIWRLQAQFDTQGLIDALRNEDAGIRKRAAAALRALGATSAIPSLTAALEKEQDTDTRANILAALAALEQEKERVEDDTVTREVTMVDRLLNQLNNPEPEKVIDAVNKLGDLKNKRAVEPLVVLFNNNKNPVKVRLAVAEALLKLESAPVEVALLGALRSSKWRVRRNGAAILGQMKADWAVQPLALALKDENEIVRKTAQAALRYINTPEARAAVEGMKEDSGKPQNPSPVAPITLIPSEPPAKPSSTPSNKAAPTPTVKSDVDSAKPPTQPSSTTTPTMPVSSTPKSDTAATIPTPTLKPDAESAKPPTKPSTATAPTTPVIPSNNVAATTPTVKPDDTPAQSATASSSEKVQPPGDTAAPPVAKPETPNTQLDPVSDELRDWESPTKLSRPTQKLAWPKRVITQEDPTRLQTRPLDPKRAEDLDNNNKPDS